MNFKLYPKNWKKLSESIRFNRAKNRCECTGECGLHNGQDLIDKYNGRCRELNNKKARFAKGKVTLTVAHLCQVKSCSLKKHLKAMCNKCHLRYDVMAGEIARKNYQEMMSEHFKKKC